MATAFESQGTVFSVENTASPAVFVAVGGIKSISGIDSGQSAVIDVTTLDSTGKEKLIGLQDAGQMSLSLNYDGTDAGQAALAAARASRAVTNFKLEFTDGETLTFAGFVLSFSKELGVDAVVDSSVSIEVTGTFTSTREA